MEDSARRQITWVIVAGLIAVLIILVVHQRTAVSRALGRIEHGTPTQRVAAAQELVNAGKLPEALKDQPRWIQDRVVAATGQLGTAQALRQLAEIVPVVDQPVAAEAVAYLVMAGEQGVGPAVQLLHHKEAEITGTAAAALAKIGAPAVPALLRMLGVYDDDTRAAVLGALAGIGEPAIDPLIATLRKTSPDLGQSPAEFVRGQATAYDALNGMKVKALPTVMAALLADDEPKVRETGARLLGDIIDQTAESYEHPAMAEPIPVIVPIPLADAQAVVDPVLARLRSDPDWRVRRQAALALGRLLTAGNQPKITTALVEHLGDVRAEVKAAAASALGQIRATQVAPTLVDTLITDPAGAVTELQLALRRLGGAAIGALAPALADSRAEVRRLATEVLAGIGGREAVVPLAARLFDADVVIRRLAAETLGDMTAETLVPVATTQVVGDLLAALDDQDWHVYHAVRLALAEIGGPAVEALINKLAGGDLRSKYMAQQALVDIGSDAVAALLNALRDPSAEVRHWAAVTLGEIGPGIIGPAAKLINSAAESPATRAAAARALGYTGSPAASEWLAAAANAAEPQVRRAALEAINDIRDDQGTATLVAGLNDSDPAVREVALDLLNDWQLGEVTELLEQVLAEGDLDAQRRAAIILAYHASAEANRLLAEIMGGAAEAAEADKVAEVLTATIEDIGEDPEMRRAAVKNLGAVGTPASVVVLEPLLAPDSEFVAEAVESLAKIGVRTARATGQQDQLGEAGQLLLRVFKETESDQLREQVARGLAMMREMPVAELLAELGTYPDELKPWAAGIVAAIGEPATDPTISAMDDSDDREQKRWCAVVLEVIGSRQAQRRVKRLSDEEEPDESQIETIETVAAMKKRILGHR